MTDKTPSNVSKCQHQFATIFPTPVNHTPFLKERLAHAHRRDS